MDTIGFGVGGLGAVVGDGSDRKWEVAVIV
jgi:hypothetical protein